ncbi:MAG: M48 family metallopeptidase [Bacteroidota bacterium]
MANRKRISKFLWLACLFFSCEAEESPPAQVPDTAEPPAVNMAMMCDPATYDLACLQSEETSVSDGILDVLGEIRDEFVDDVGEEVSDARQDQYGDEMRSELEKQFPVIRNHPQQKKLEGIMRKLNRVRTHPSQIDYNIYVVRAAQPNAFTLGGEIFVTTRLLDEAESLDEIACIIGHEIGHNELGHIARRIKQQELIEGVFGQEAGAVIADVASFITMGFNQRSEAEADIYGIDLALSSGYEACRGIDFWERIKRSERAENELDNLLRSHPYSGKRIKCYRDHLRDHHQHNCPN